jgi:hypothetical protein
VATERVPAEAGSGAVDALEMQLAGQRAETTVTTRLIACRLMMGRLGHLA